MQHARDKTRTKLRGNGTEIAILVSSPTKIVEVRARRSLGSAITLAGERAAQQWIAAGFARSVQPREHSIRGIRGIGALNHVSYWIRVWCVVSPLLDVGGFLVTFHDVPPNRRLIVRCVDYSGHVQAMVEQLGDPHVFATNSHTDTHCRYLHEFIVKGAMIDRGSAVEGLPSAPTRGSRATSAASPTSSPSRTSSRSSST